MGRTWTYTYTSSDLTSVTDPLGNVTSYGYDTGNANPLLVADITTITRPNGQAGGANAGDDTTIGWTSTGQATSVTDPMGYKASYSTTSYNPATGTGFIIVTDADGYTTDYYYLGGSLAARSDWTGSTLTSERDYVPDQSAARHAARRGYLRRRGRDHQHRLRRTATRSPPPGPTASAPRQRRPRSSSPA